MSRLGLSTRIEQPTLTRPHRPRRRREVVVTAAVAAAAVIAVPAVYLAGDEPARDPVTSGQPAAGATYDLLTDVTEGEPAQVPYLSGTTLVRPDGSTLELPRAYDQFVPLGDGLVAGYDAQGTRRLDLLDSTGKVTGSTPVEAGFVVDGTGDLVAWATPQGELVVRWPAGALSLGNQGGPVAAAAVTGSAGCDDCRVYVNNVDGRAPAWVEPDGSVGPVAPGALKVNDVDGDGRAAVQLSSGDTGSCSGVYLDGDLAWKTCRNSLTRFSPEGTYLIGNEAYLDGLGRASLSVLRTGDGEEVATFTITGGFIARQAWEDDSHVLVVISGPDGWELLRLGLDGSRERVAGPVAPADDPTRTLLVLSGNF